MTNLANDDLEDLRRLCSVSKLDLFVLIREFEKLGLPSLSMKVDCSPAVPAVSRVIGYQLGEGLQVVLAALRAGHADTDEIERTPCEIGAFAGHEKGPSGFI